MRQLLTIAAVAAVLSLGLLVPRSSSAPALPEKPVRYEYAELRYSRTVVGGGPRFGGQGGLAGGPGAAGGNVPAAAAVAAQPATEIKTVIKWTTGQEELEVKEWEELADKLKAPAPKKVSPQTVHKLRLLNKLSADGWELMDRALGGDATSSAAFRDRGFGESGSSTLTFRRLVK